MSILKTFRIILKVTPNAHKNSIEELEPSVVKSAKTLEPHNYGYMRIRVTAPPEDGKANQEVIKLLAEHFKVPKKNVIIVRGQTSRQKLVEVIPETHY
jgi:uncharacterized protein (TIGR00251 family)